jgi:hypothetical protein
MNICSKGCVNDCKNDHKSICLSGDIPRSKAELLESCARLDEPRLPALPTNLDILKEFLSRIQENWKNDKNQRIHVNLIFFVDLVPLGNVSQSLKIEKPGDTTPKPKRYISSTIKKFKIKIIILNYSTCTRFCNNSTKILIGWKNSFLMKYLQNRFK